MRSVLDLYGILRRQSVVTGTAADRRTPGYIHTAALLLEQHPVGLGQ